MFHTEEIKTMKGFFQEGDPSDRQQWQEAKFEASTIDSTMFQTSTS